MDRARLDRLQGWIEGEGIAFGPISSVAPIAGGTQNRLLRVRAGDRELVRRGRFQRSRGNAAPTARECRYSTSDGFGDDRRDCRSICRGPHLDRIG